MLTSRFHSISENQNFPAFSWDWRPYPLVMIAGVPRDAASSGRNFLAAPNPLPPAAALPVLFAIILSC
jgi:hypothetical protein